jgi:tetrahydromethanopterin S-methyltransferase subunit G
MPEIEPTYFKEFREMMLKSILDIFRKLDRHEQILEKLSVVPGQINEINKKLDQHDQKFNIINGQLTEVNRKLDVHEDQIAKVTVQLTEVGERLDSIDTRLDSIDTKLDKKAEQSEHTTLVKRVVKLEHAIA